MTVDTTKEPCPFCGNVGASVSRITGQLAWQNLMTFRAMSDEEVESVRVLIQKHLARGDSEYDAFMWCVMARSVVGKGLGPTGRGCDCG
jgi:hypothetical protein